MCIVLCMLCIVWMFNVYCVVYCIIVLCIILCMLCIAVYCMDV